MNITEQARKAAENESLECICRRIGHIGDVKQEGYFVQLAINAACAEKDKEIERLKVQQESRIAPSLIIHYGQVQAERDALKSRLAEIEGIAKELAERIEMLQFHYVMETGSILQNKNAIARYTAFLAANPEGK